jgi:hypothetical protein
MIYILGYLQDYCLRGADVPRILFPKGVWGHQKICLVYRITIEFSVQACWNTNGTINCVKIQNYWVFGLCPSSGILETMKHSFSETGSVSVLRWPSSSILETMTHSVSETGSVSVLRWPSSSILETMTHSVSETGSVSVLRWRGKYIYSVGSLRNS